MLITKPNIAGGGTTTAASLYHQGNKSIHVTDGVTVISISASVLHKISAATDRPCQIALNRKLSLKFENCCKFWSRVNAKSLKKMPVCNKFSSTFERVYWECSSSLLLYSPLKVAAINEMFFFISSFDTKLFISYCYAKKNGYSHYTRRELDLQDWGWSRYSGLKYKSSG